MEDPNPPLTAKQAALEGAQADKPPFNPDADRRHVIASVLRRTAEATGQSELSADPVDELRLGAVASDAALPETVDVTSDAQAQTESDWTATIDSPATADMSLAQIIVADQAASRGFAAPGTPDDGPPPGIDPLMDTLRSRDSMAGAFDTQANDSPSQSEFSDLAGVFDASLSPNIASAMPLRAPEAPLPIQDSQFDASMLLSSDAPRQPLDFWPGVSDAGDVFGPMNPSSSTQLPPDTADERIGPKVQVLSSAAMYPDQSRADESLAPISYLPFGQSASQPNVDGASVEKVRIEFESSMAEVKRDSVLVFTGMEPAFITLVEHMGEQDRRDAFALAASRRACL